jgi:3-oxoadipate enol-lactonase
VKLVVNGAALEYDVRGSGPAVLFLHAFPLDRTMWDETLATLGDTYRSIRFDARGFGGSPAGDGPLTMERIADDAVAVLDHLQLERAVVCGCSMGGYAAFAMVRRHAARLRGLVLADTRAIPDAEDTRRGRAELAAKVRQHGPVAVRDAMLPKLLGPTSFAQRRDVVARVEAMILAGSAEGIANALDGLAARADSRPTLGSIRIPAWVVRGVEDAVVPAPEAEAMAAGIPGARLGIIPAAGHLPPLETPAAFGAALTDWLATLPPDGVQSAAR